MVIYTYEGAHNNLGDVLVKKALACFAGNVGIPISQEMLAHTNICRTKRGKPYFEELPVHFSVSHSGGLWACLMSEHPVGLDVQEERSVNYQKLAGRYFTEEECAYVDAHGASGFFIVWTLKEACVKYFGTGLAVDLRRISVILNGKPAAEVHSDGQWGFPVIFDLRGEIPGMRCAHCSGKKDEKVWIERLK